VGGRGRGRGGGGGAARGRGRSARGGRTRDGRALVNRRVVATAAAVFVLTAFGLRAVLRAREATVVLAEEGPLRTVMGVAVDRMTVLVVAGGILRLGGAAAGWGPPAIAASDCSRRAGDHEAERQRGNDKPIPRDAASAGRGLH